MSWALGAQYREDELERELPNAAERCRRAPRARTRSSIPPAACLIPNGVFGFVGPQREFEIDSDVYGVFGELGLPITDSLQAQLAFRYEDYGDSTGSTSNPKLALRWQATDWLALRGSASSTFRGPVLLQLQPNPLTSLQFVPQFATVRPVDNFGNPNLKPEEADNFSVGALISAGPFSASIDYFDIRLQGQSDSRERLGRARCLHRHGRDSDQQLRASGLRSVAGALHVPERRVRAGEHPAHARDGRECAGRGGQGNRRQCDLSLAERAARRSHVRARCDLQPRIRARSVLHRRHSHSERRRSRLHRHARRCPDAARAARLAVRAVRDAVVTRCA